MKMMLRGMFLLMMIGMGSTFLNLRCIACHNDVANAEYAQMAKEIVEQNMRE